MTTLSIPSLLPKLARLAQRAPSQLPRAAHPLSISITNSSRTITPRTARYLSTSPSISMHTTFEKANDKYVETFGDKGSIPIPPGKKLIVVTCMDARIEPFMQLGLKEGDAHIIRNAGGVAKDALRSIVISQRMLGTREIALFHHTDCGLVKFTTPELRNMIKEQQPGDEEAAKIVDGIDFLEFKDEKSSVVDDVEWLRAHPLVLKGTVVTGWLYHPDTGKVSRIA